MPYFHTLEMFYKIKGRLLPSVELSKSFLIGPLCKRLVQILRAQPVTIDGLRFFVDDLDTLGLFRNKNYCPGEQSFYRKTIKPGFHCIDLGANIGFFTALFAVLAGESGKVYAFEPWHVNVALLRRNMAINGLHNVTIFQKAILDIDGSSDLFLSPRNRGDHCIYKDLNEQRDSIKVEIVRLDSLFGSRPPMIDFIKMDIQGAEYKALLGMKSILDNSPNVRILLEFFPFGLKRCGSDPRELLKLIDDLGFEFKILNDRGEMEKTSSEYLCNTYRPEDEYEWTNLVLMKK